MAEHHDVRLQTHINENRREIAEVSRLFPWAGDYLAIYERYNLCGNRSVMAHNVHATGSEIERLAAAGTAVAHCPASNAALGSGCFPLKRHVDAGVTCALGTDVGGGVGFGMLKEGLHAYLMQRLAPDAQPLDAARLLYLATRAGAEALGLESEIGDFRPGKAADFVYLRPPAGSVLESVVRHADSPGQVLSALFTMAEFGDRARGSRRRSNGIFDRSMTLDDVNSRDRLGFVEAVGWVFEHSPWVADRVWTQQPFSTVNALYKAMTSEVASATFEEQLALLRAHPDLGTRSEDVGCLRRRNRRVRVLIA